MKLRFYCGVLLVFAVLYTGCKNEQQSAVVVSGVGTVMAQPDTAHMSVSITKTMPTTKAAQEAVNVMVRQTLDILQNAGIEEKNISTASLSFFPEYEWEGVQQRRVQVGQRAQQIITFSTETISALSDIIDNLVQINGIELQQVYFSIKDNTELYAQSRELAYQKAREKAEQYARLSGLKIVKTAMINEEGVSISPLSNNRMMRNEMVMADAKAVYAAGSTALPTGEMEITSRIMVEFLMK